MRSNLFGRDRLLGWATVLSPEQPSGDDAIHLKDLGVVTVHVDAVRSRHVPDVLRVRIPPVLLRRVLLQRGHLPLDVLLLEGDVPLVREVEVVPRDLVAEDRRALERAQALLRDRLMILVDVVQARLEDDLGPPVLPQADEQLEDLLPPLGERAHVEVVHGEPVLGDAELGGRVAHFARERVRREAVGERARRDREREVADVAAGLDEPRHRAAATELAVVRVRREHERALPMLDHAWTASRTWAAGGGGSGARAGGSANAMSPNRSQVVGSSKKSL